MNIDLEILDKTEKNIKEDIKISGTTDIVKLKEVKAIQNAIREHLLFIGLDRGNNIRNISVLGIGNSCNVIIDSKDIIRTALFSCSDKVVLVHNHPSNTLRPSEADIHITNVTNKILEVFNIELIDHIIVTENNYVSMYGMKQIDRNYNDKDFESIDKGLLLEENQNLRKQIEELKEQLQEKESDFYGGIELDVKQNESSEDEEEER